MIELTRVNNQKLVVNCDLIKTVEQAHDTVLTLVNGDKIVVRERLRDVVRSVIDYRREIVCGLSLFGSCSPPILHTPVTAGGEE